MKCPVDSVFKKRANGIKEFLKVIIKITHNQKTGSYTFPVHSEIAERLSWDFKTLVPLSENNKCPLSKD